MDKFLFISCFCGVYLYVGLVRLGGVSGYLWLLGWRLYLKTSWRPSDAMFLGPDFLGVVVKIRRAQGCGGCVGEGVDGFAVRG